MIWRNITVIIASKIKKSIFLIGTLALSVGAFGKTPKNEQEAIDKYTGSRQPKSGNYELCVSVFPYFLEDFSGHANHFFGFVLNGISPIVSNTPGECFLPNEVGQCERGFVKITSTIELHCHVPVA